MLGSVKVTAVLLTAVVVAAGCQTGDGSQAPTDPAPSTTVPTLSPSPTVTVEPAPSIGDMVQVEVFFMNAGLGDVCSEVFPVPREVPAAAPLREAFEALLAGPTPAERDAGYEGWFTTATAGLLDRVRLEGTRAQVAFRAALPATIPNASTSCGSIGLLAQLDRTATQFPTVDEAWYSLEGDRAAFYGWLQMAAPDDPGPLPPDDGATTEPASDPEPTPTTAEPSPPDGARTVPASLAGTEWTTLPTSEPTVALTFDAGANGDAVASILATLQEQGVPATFFLTGRWVIAYPTWAQAIGARYPVGNHTQTHPDLTQLSPEAIDAEILTAHDGIAAATGRDPRPWFRFPYGARDPATVARVNQLAYGSVRWTTDTLGWKGTSGGITADLVVNRVLADLQPGQIVLMHVGSHPTDGSTLDADALPEVIRRVREAGYGFIDLDALLART